MLEPESKGRVKFPFIAPGRGRFALVAFLAIITVLAYVGVGVIHARTQYKTAKDRAAQDAAAHARDFERKFHMVHEIQESAPFLGMLASPVNMSLNSTERKESGLSSVNIDQFKSLISAHNSTLTGSMLQLQPGGVIAFCHPNCTVIGLDLWNLPAQNYSYRDIAMNVLPRCEGPIYLAQGMMAIVCRTPVYSYHDTEDGEDACWTQTCALGECVSFSQAVGISFQNNTVHPCLTSSVLERRFWGMVSDVMPVDALLGSLGIGQLEEHYHVQVYSVILHDRKEHQELQYESSHVFPDLVDIKECSRILLWASNRESAPDVTLKICLQPLHFEPSNTQYLVKACLIGVACLILTGVVIVVWPSFRFQFVRFVQSLLCRLHMIPVPSAFPPPGVHPSNKEFTISPVTIVFIDIQDFAALWEAIPHTMADVLQMHDNVTRTLIDSCRGYEVKGEGDAFMIAFDAPLAAFLFVVSLQETVASLPWPEDLELFYRSSEDESWSGLRVRCGMATGMCRLQQNPLTGRMDYFGSTPSLAARVQSQAAGGQILVSRTSLDTLCCHDEKCFDFLECLQSEMQCCTLRHFGDVLLKGIQEKHSIYELSSSRLQRTVVVHGKSESAAADKLGIDPACQSQATLRPRNIYLREIAASFRNAPGRKVVCHSRGTSPNPGRKSPRSPTENQSTTDSAPTTIKWRRLTIPELAVSPPPPGGDAAAPQRKSFPGAGWVTSDTEDSTS